MLRRGSAMRGSGSGPTHPKGPGMICPGEFALDEYTRLTRADGCGTINVLPFPAWSRPSKHMRSPARVKRRDCERDPPTSHQDAGALAAYPAAGVRRRYRVVTTGGSPPARCRSASCLLGLAGPDVVAG